MENHLLVRARKLRKNSTDTEQRLWYFLRAKRFNGYKFKRQYIIGNYIVDFICIENKLIIELDGSQHIDAIKYDMKRTNYLIDRGYNVLRFWNNDVLQNTDGVLQEILNVLPPSPSPSPPAKNAGGRGDEFLLK